MVIKFVCPNGHQLSTSNDRAGKPGKCPKCETKFLVPEPEEENDESTVEEETIAFLCPNGHELNGPASLKGRPGQCPHCGEKFQIPTFDDEDDEEEGLPAEPDSHSQEILQEADAVLEVEEFEEIEEVQEAEAPSFPELSSDNSFAEIFAQFWQHREEGQAVKLTLRDGKTIEPEYFSASLSQGDHGFFAVKEGNGNHTLTVARWGSILRLDVGQGDQLPPGIFD